MKAKMLSILLCVIALVGLTTFVVLAAPPTGPDSLTQVESSKRTNFNDTIKSVEAEAGNVTELAINITRQTDHWQGYYGNISGLITLDNANNFTMYSWTGLADVAGNIYATGSNSIVWTDVYCANISSQLNKSGCGGVFGGGECLNITEMHNKYGMTDNDGDNINKTFTSTNSIIIDTRTLADCPATNLYQNDSSQISYWNETLLVENNTENLIFAVNAEDDIYGFNSKTWDFQMIVGEDETAGTTTYYFYVELA